MTHRSRYHLRACLLVGLFWLAASTVAAQHPRFSSGEPHEVRFTDADLRFEQLPLEGFPHPIVRCILQDRKGFMWFGTDDGLVKYDGYSYVVFRPDMATVPGDDYTVQALHEDAHGMLWIGTARAGLSRLDPSTGQFTHYQYDAQDPNSISSDNVWAIHEDRDGVLWVGTFWGGFNRFDPATGQFTRYQHDPNDPNSLSHRVVRTIYEDRDGALWIGTENGGLNRFDPATGQFTRYQHDPTDPTSLSSNLVQAIYEDRDGVFWIGAGHDTGGLHRFDPETGRFTRYRHDPTDPTSLSANTVTSIQEDRFGNFWVGTNHGGLNRFDRATAQFTRYQHDLDRSRSLSSDDVWTLYEGRDGILWIGTLGMGVNRLNPPPRWFTHWRHDPRDPNSLGIGEVLAIYEAPAASRVLWIGTRGGGLSRLDSSSGQFTQYRFDPAPSNLTPGNVHYIHEDRSGMFWLGLGLRGLGQFDPTTGRFTPHQPDPEDPHGLSIRTALRIHEGRSGMLWIGTPYGRLERLDPSTGQVTYRWRDPEVSPINDNKRIWALLDDASGSLWVGVGGLGLKRLDPSTGQVAVYKHDPANPNSLSSNRVHALYEDTRGRRWIGTRSGLNLWDPDTGHFRRFTRPEAPLRDNIQGILEDDDGNLWLSTADGLSVFRAMPGEETFLRHYTTINGQRLGTFSPGAYHKGDSGTLYFGGKEGLYAIHPALLHEAPAPPVFITGVKLFGEPVAVSPDGSTSLTRHVSDLDEIVLPHDADIVSFTFAALDYTDPARNQYAYKLDGFHDEWIYQGTRREATFTNLDPGSYVLRVKAANSDGVWNEEGGDLKILKILPPWWRTTWAYMLYGLLFVAGVFAAGRIQRRRLIRKERAKAELREKDLRAEAAEAMAKYLQSENLRQTQELDAARDLQLSMLPAAMPEHPTVELAASMQTATEVGGDYYDFDLSDDGTLTLAIGDATGHGTKAGTMVTAAKSLFMHCAREPDLANVLNESTRTLKRMGLPKLYMALALVRLQGHTLELAGAGMPPALVYRAATRQVETIPLKGMPLGGPGTFPYQKTCVLLSAGDTVMLMSDGFPELFNNEGEMLGYERAVSVFEEAAAQSPEEIIAHMRETSVAWANGRAQDDDVTFVVMKMKASTGDQGAGAN